MQVRKARKKGEEFSCPIDLQSAYQIRRTERRKAPRPISKGRCSRSSRRWSDRVFKTRELPRRSAKPEGGSRKEAVRRVIPSVDRIRDIVIQPDHNIF